jgi:hypothetical protein
MVRTSVVDEGPYWVGQQVLVVVELLAPGYFSSAASFDLPDPQGVLLMPPTGHPVVGSETIDGTRFTVQRHELHAWPMRSGDIDIPALAARFSFKRNPLDSEEVPAAVRTSAIALSVEQPPGSEGLGTVISARGLQVTEHWQPQPGADAVKAGSAFIRTITFTASDVPGMVFPPFPAGEIDGLGIYGKQQLQDHELRGVLEGQRSDVITYVCQQPGQFSIPAVRFTWFDLDSQELRHHDFPALVLNVVDNPELASAGEGKNAPVGFDIRAWGRAAAVLGLLALLLLAAMNPHVRRLSGRAIAALRPVHLQPLNPRVVGSESGARVVDPGT